MAKVRLLLCVIKEAEIDLFHIHRILSEGYRISSRKASFDKSFTTCMILI